MKHFKCFTQNFISVIFMQNFNQQQKKEFNHGIIIINYLKHFLVRKKKQKRARIKAKKHEKINFSFYLFRC